MSLKQHYCEVDQDQANEARELLVMAGEQIWMGELSFEVDNENTILAYREGTILKGWIVLENTPPLEETYLTYPQFKEMLNEKINQNGNTI